MILVEIRYSYKFNPFLVDSFFHCAPGFYPKSDTRAKIFNSFDIFVTIRPYGERTSHTPLFIIFFIHHCWRAHQQQVNLADSKLKNESVNSPTSPLIAIITVPDLCRYKEILSGDPAISYGPSKGYVSSITIRSIEMTVTKL